MHSRDTPGRVRKRAEASRAQGAGGYARSLAHARTEVGGGDGRGDVLRWQRVDGDA